MSARTLHLDDPLHGYLLEHSLREPDAARRLREMTRKMPEANMQIAPEQGQLLHLLALAIGARQVLEVGTFTGYSALWLARALPPDGRLVACDRSREWTDLARPYWAEAGVAGKIDLRLGPARETLDGLLAEGAAGTLDLAFIDADKEGYPDYYERSLDLLRPGGLVLADNTLWHGRVADPDAHDPDTLAIRDFNDHLHRDQRVDVSLVPIGDGLTVARKR